MKKLIYYSILILAFVACENQDQEFPDYKYTTVYFPYQSPVRTIVLGEDIYDNTLDKAHKCKIMATMGGVYKNTTDRILNIAIDNTLCDSLLFDGDTSKKVLAMPSNYYTLENNMQITIPAGSISGGIEVQLSDAFFTDPKSVENTYVIPLRITSVKNADSILSGKSLIQNPNFFIASDWTAAPKNYILYCIKYINPWHGAYLLRGTDIGKGSSGFSKLDTTIVYHKQYVEKDTVVKLYTVSMNEVRMSFKTRNKGSNNDVPYTILLSIDNSGKCSITAPDTVSYKISGNGEFVNDGDMWGGEKRDVMHLKYNVDFDSVVHSFNDTLVLRDRQVKMEIFNPVLQ